MARLQHLTPLLISVLLFCGIARAQQTPRRFQYRFGRDSIPEARADEPKAARFSSDEAKHYLDLGATLWRKQKKCVSCHTHGIYMVTRPALSKNWGRPSADERKFVVDQSKEIIQEDDRTGTSPTRMAYIARGLAEWDAEFRETTSSETDAALRYLFEMQADDGGIQSQYRWPPLNSDSYHGSIMAAMAVATAPAWRSGLEDQPLLARIEKLESYLRETLPKTNHHRVLLLWASTRLPNLVSEQQRQEIVKMIWQQQREDGGWSIRTFATPESLGGGKRAEKLRTDPHYFKPSSDGYQTGLAVVVLRDAGVSADDPRIQKAVKWLLSNQRQSGRWWTRSLNTESRFHFITYSGSAYAALALAKCNALDGP